MKNRIPIFLSSDNNYAFYIPVLIASICDNTDNFCEFYILDGGIEKQNKEEILKLKKIFNNFSCEFVKIDYDKFFGDFVVESYITKATYFRFIIADLFLNIDKAIYLDIDIILKGDISRLFNIDLKDFIIGAVVDQGNKLYISKLKKNLNMDIFSDYFNCGVLLINLEKWRKENITEKLFEIEKKYRGNLPCNDQDVFNKFFENNYMKLPVCFNSMIPHDCEIVRHYYNPIKPWHLAQNLCINEYRDYNLFWYYAKKVGLKDKIDCKYKTKHQLQVLKLYENKSKIIVNNPKVSVVVPIYNAEFALRRCLDSLINQTLSDIEIICVNDGSVDNSSEILNEYSSFDKRIKIINFKKNKGAAFSRNTAIKEAKGEYIGFVDSDDFVDLDFFEKLYNQDKKDILKGADLRVMYDDLNTDIWMQNELILENKYNFWAQFTTAIYRKDFLLKNEIFFPEDLSICEDIIFIFKAVFYCNDIKICNDGCYFYNKKKEELNSFYDEKKLQDFFKYVDFTVDFIENNIILPDDKKIIYSRLIKQIDIIKKYKIEKNCEVWIKKLNKLYQCMIIKKMRTK